MPQPLNLTYSGWVEEVDDDPEQLGRLKARVPVVYGPANGPNSITTADIPWAMPAGLPAGGTPDSGAISWLPRVGDHVYLRFLDGAPEQPIWEWAMQDREQAKQFPYWKNTAYGSTPPAERPTVLTRYGHSLEISPDSIMLRTASGFKVRLTDSTGQLDLYAKKVKTCLQSTELTGDTCSINMNAIEAHASAVNVKATEIEISAVHNKIIGAIANLLQAPHIELGPDGLAIDPVVRLSDLVLVATAIMTQFDLHKHITISVGKPTTPPIEPMVLVPTGSSTTFTA